MSYDDAWSRSQPPAADPTHRFTKETPPDPRHGDMSVPPEVVVMQNAPATVLPGGGEIIADFDMDPVHQYTELDRTPWNGQGDGTTTGHGHGGYSAPGASKERLAAPHGADFGAGTAGTSDPPPYHSYDERWSFLHTEGMSTLPVHQLTTHPRFIRGLNGFPQNNGPVEQRPGVKVVGDGWRRGLYDQQVLERPYGVPKPLWEHTNTPGEKVNAVTDGVTPPSNAQPTRTATKYGPVFPALQRMTPARQRRPGLRRDPLETPWDENLITADDGVGGFEGTLIP